MTEAVQTGSTTSETAVIELTDEAAERLEQEMARYEGEATALRLMVQQGGCCGMQYAMSFAKGEPTDIETVLETGSVPIYLETQLLETMEGSTIRWVEGPMGSGFQIDNPNAENACGC